MRLFIPFLSVLLPEAVTSQEGSGYGEDVLEIEGCSTVYFPSQYIANFADQSSFCDAVAADLAIGSLKGCFHTCVGDGTPDDKYVFDDDFQVKSIVDLGFAQAAFDENGTPLAADKSYGCVDLCIEASTDVDVVGGTTALDAAQYVRGEAKDAVIAALGITTQFEMDNVAATPIRGEAEVIEGEGSGAPDDDTTTDVTTTTQEPFAEYFQCVSLYFPTMWILQTAFPDIFDFCNVYEYHFCSPWDSVGAKCWQPFCSTSCTGDGTPDVDYLMDDDADAQAADDQTDQDGCWDGNKVDQNADPNVFGCFDVCWRVHATNSHIDEISQMYGLARYVSGLGASQFWEKLGEEALVQTFVDGPNGDDGYPGGIQGLTDDTNANPNFQCDGGATCNAGNIENAGASTTWQEKDDEVVSGRDCNDGNNGGCSHVCEGEGSNGVCACPNECWELDEDQQSCTIPFHKVQLSCESDRMVAHLAACVVRGNSNFMLGNDNNCNELHDEVMDMANPIVSQTAACQASSNITDPLSEGCITFDVKLDECSTKVEANYADNILTFTQTLVSDVAVHMQTGPIGLGAIVSKSPRVSVEFTCEYRTDYETSPGNAIVSPDEVNNALEAQGQFVFNLNTIVRDAGRSGAVSSGWSIHDSQSDPYMVGSTLYFEICHSNPLHNIYFSVPDCTVKNYNNTESYKILDGHQLDVFVGTARVGRQYGGVYEDWAGDKSTNVPMPAGSAHEASDVISNECLVFSYTVFEFVSSAEDDGDLRLSCDVHACNYDDEEPDDIEPCLDLSSRKRRSTDSETYYRVAVDVPIKHATNV